MNEKRYCEIAAKQDWATVDQLYEACLEDGGVFTEVDYEHAQEKAFKALIRRVMQRMTTPGGNKAFANVESADEDGNVIRIYKQEALFNAQDYVYAARYHFMTSKKHWEEGMRYKSTGEQRFAVQIPLPWLPEADEGIA